MTITTYASPELVAELNAAREAAKAAPEFDHAALAAARAKVEMLENTKRRDEQTGHHTRHAYASLVRDAQQRETLAHVISSGHPGLPVIVGDTPSETPAEPVAYVTSNREVRVYGADSDQVAETIARALGLGRDRVRIEQRGIGEVAGMIDPAISAALAETLGVPVMLGEIRSEGYPVITILGEVPEWVPELPLRDAWAWWGRGMRVTDRQGRPCALQASGGVMLSDEDNDDGSHTRVVGYELRVHRGPFVERKHPGSQYMTPAWRRGVGNAPNVEVTPADGKSLADQVKGQLPDCVGELDYRHGRVIGVQVQTRFGWSAPFDEPESTGPGHDYPVKGLRVEVTYLHRGQRPRQKFGLIG